MNDVYKASNSEFDEHGWKGILAITFEEGLITKVVYDEVNEDGILKIRRYRLSIILYGQKRSQYCRGI